MTPSNGHHATPTDNLDQMYNALSHPVRRQLLLIIQEENPCSLEEIVAMHPKLERQKQAAIVKLHHVHLPKLAQADVIEWERESETIRKGPQFEDVRPHLNLLSEQR